MGSKQDKKHTESKGSKKTKKGHKREIETVVVVSILVIVLGLGVGWWLNSRSDNDANQDDTNQSESVSDRVELVDLFEGAKQENQLKGQELNQADLTIAATHLDEGRPNEAISTYLAILERDPSNYLANVNLGYAYESTEDNENALTYYQKALDLLKANTTENNADDLKALENTIKALSQ